MDLIYEKSGTAQIPGIPAEQPVEEPAAQPVRQIVNLPAEPVKQIANLPHSADKDSVQADVLQVFSEVTKYPEDMLELEMEMEADLGIDTVKQATILSILGEKYMLERDEGMQLSNYPTIGHIVDLIYEKAGSATMPPEPAEVTEITTEPAPEVKTPEIISLEESNLSREVVVLAEEKLGKKDFNLKNKNVWLLGESETEMKKIAAALEGKKANVSLFTFSNIASQKDLEQAVAEFSEGKTADVIIDSSHTGTTIYFDQLPPDQAQQVLLMNSDARFILYKNLSNKLPHPAKIICLTAIDGSMGYDFENSNVTDPSFGALIGFYKALRKEWIDSEVKIIDFSPRVISDEFDPVSEKFVPMKN